MGPLAVRVHEHAYVIVWEYRVKPEHTSDFETTYGPNGAWAHLFRRADGFVETNLWHSADRRESYMTADVWKSKAHFERFQDSFRVEYVALDDRTSPWTLEERRRSATIGEYVQFDVDGSG